MKSWFFLYTGTVFSKKTDNCNIANEKKSPQKKKFCLQIIIVALFLLCGAEAKAEVKTWNGGATSGLDWTVPGNWLEGSIPVAGDDVVFNTPGTLIFATLPSTPIAYNSLTISQGDVTLAGASAITFTIGGNSGTDFIVASGALLTVGANVTIAMADNSTADISGTLTNNNIFDTGSINTVTTVSGTLINKGTISNSANTRLIFSSGSTYQHDKNGGVIPDATWASTSNCNITGIIWDVPIISSATQPFGNFTWNCTGQTSSIDLKGTLTSINGDFTILSTNTYFLELSRDVSCNLTVRGNAYVKGNFGIGATGTYSNTMTVDGDFSFVSGTHYISPNNGNAILNVGGNLSSSGNLSFTYTGYPAQATVNVNGNVTVTAGTFSLSGTSSTGTLNVNGNFTHSGGTITELSTGSGSIIFSGTGTQVFTSGGTISKTINFTVSSGSTLQMGTGASPSILSGSDGYFTLSPGATLGITSTSGISKTTAAGNIQVTGTRTYSPGASYIYNGTSAQTTGDGLMQNTPANLTIDNSAGVTLSEATTISGLLALSNGTLNMANINLTVGSLTGAGGITNTSGTPSNVTITAGSDNTSPAAYSGVIENGNAGSVSLIKTGTGTLTLSGVNTYTGATAISGGTLQFGVAGSISSSSNVILNGGTLRTGATTGYSQAPGTLNLQSASTIALGTGEHSVTFGSSKDLSWASGAKLTITGWSGTPGSGGLGGRVFFGSDATGLKTDQLSQITFYGYNPGAVILSTGEITPTGIPAISIASPDPAVDAGNIIQQASDNVIYRFDNAVTLGDAVMTGLQITTDGTYSSSDISSLKSWYSTDDTFNSSSDKLLSTITSSPGPGPHIFPSWTDQIINAGTTGYIFITADIPCTTTLGAIIYVTAVQPSDVTFIAGNNSGLAFDGGEQTITNSTPVNVTGVAATIDDARSVLSWANPSGCFSEVMIVAKAGSAVSVVPSGTSYTADLSYGSGSTFGGGYVLYRGSVSPQTVTNLSNGTTYYYTFFTRNASDWSTGITTSARAMASADIAYRSVRTGNWSDASTWEAYDGSVWGAASTPPSSTNGEVTIRSGHTVTINQPVALDQVTVETGGKVTVNNVTMTIANGDGDDFTVNGTLELTGASGVITTTGNLAFKAGGTYIHNRNNGVIPTATWAITSTCSVTGIINSVPVISSATQPFGNFTWNCVSQSGLIDLAGTLTSIDGNFTILSTGTAFVELSRAVSCNLRVKGDAYVDGNFAIGAVNPANTMTVDGNFRFVRGTHMICNATGTTTLNIGGDLYSSGMLYFTFTNFPGAATVNVTGNVFITGGTFNLSRTSSTGILNVGGNFTHSGGTITESSTGSGTVVFNGTGTQVYTAGGTISNTIDFTVNSGSTLQMAAEGTAITGGGTFTLLSGATLGITSADGITAEPGTLTGNIRTTTGRVFNIGANYTYNGTGAQATGTGLPTGALKGTLTIASGAVVTSTNAIVSDGIITVNGTLIPGAATRVINGSGILAGSGTVVVNRTAPTADFSSQYTISTKNLAALTVEYSDPAGSQVVSPLTYFNLKLDNTSGTNTMGGAATVSGTLTTTAGGTFDVGLNQLTVDTLLNNGSITINSTGVGTNGSMTVSSASGSGTAT